MVTAGLPIKIVGYLKVLIPVFFIFCELRLITTATVNHSGGDVSENFEARKVIRHDAGFAR